MSSNKDQLPSLVGGHANYVKGVTEAGIGKVTGSQAWTTSGEQAKADAVSDLKAAGEARHTSHQGYGKAEATVGKAVGCLKEGDESPRQG